jgi:EAL domain-containing protein (putative c-di-GMP-specific phosphodiesterase class I)
VASRILATLALPLPVDGQLFRLTASVGIAPGHAAHARPEEVLRDADIALYRAKDAGRAGYALFDPVMQAQLRARLDLERDLRHGLERDEFVLHYQPLVTVPDGQIIGVEALVRWQHPSRGLLGPGTFIPLAEETGLIVPLGRWILEESCRQARAWQDADPDMPALRISVNVAAGQLRSSALLVDVARALAATALPPDRLQLEITEGAAMADAATTVVVLQELKDLGVRLALDDFGTGYSSLAYLKRFPVDALKIDRAFVDGLGEKAAHGAEDEAIVEVVLGVARALRLEVTAEGVETAAQLARLRVLGCAMAQGYLFARPLPATELAVLLRSGMLADPDRTNGESQVSMTSARR